MLCDQKEQQTAVQKRYKFPNEIFEMQENVIELIYNCEVEDHEIQTNLFKTALDEQVL